MPELPEVETIKRVIEPQITGRNVISVIVNNSQVIAYPDEENFIMLLSNQKVKNMSRRGKEYRNTPFLRVYGHERESCKKCGTAFSRIVIGGRSSVYCSCCQK